MNGILLFNKPIGWTSHDAVAFVRRRLNVKAGHAGTLDPMATGLLLILLGAATRRSSEFLEMDKTYRGLMELGLSTDTQDLEGRVLSRASSATVTEAQLRATLQEVAAQETQVPPLFSAVKRGGRALYKTAHKLAASGGVLTGDAPAGPIEPRPAKVHEWRLEKFENPEAEFYLRTAKGFYVRTFCHDVGQRLGCGAALTCLVRTRIGPHDLNVACSLEDLGKEPRLLQTEALRKRGALQEE